MSALCLSRRLAGAAVAFLVCSASFAQQASQPAPQANTKPPQSSSSQLPDAPGPVVAPSRTPTGETARPQSRSSSSSSPPAPLYWSESKPNVPVTVLEDTRLSVMTSTPISTDKIREGGALAFLLDEAVAVDGLVVIPRGATVHGSVVAVRKAGKLTGSPDLILKLDSLELEGRSYPLYSYEFEVEGASKTPPTERKIKTGTSIGTAVGTVVGAGLNRNADGTPSLFNTLVGVSAGAAVGAGTGTVVAAATPGPAIDIPAESEIDFSLAAPISVMPVSRREAERLSEGLSSGGPVLYVRGERP